MAYRQPKFGPSPQFGRAFEALAHLDRLGGPFNFSLVRQGMPRGAVAQGPTQSLTQQAWPEDRYVGKPLSVAVPAAKGPSRNVTFHIVGQFQSVLRRDRPRH